MSAAPGTVRLLLVEDHLDIAELVAEDLEREGYVVDYAADGASGLHLAVSNDYELIVLDLMLPGLDGVDLCRRLRAQARRDTPVLMLTARDTLEVSRDGRALSLTPIGLRLLGVLMRASPRVVTRQELEQAVWGELLPDSDTLRSHLYTLRKAIDRPFERPLLHTLPGLGYRLAEVEAG